MMSDLWEDIPGSWTGVRAVAATRHAMFVLHADGELYRIDPIGGEYTASLGRFSSQRLVAHGDHLFVFDDDGTLYRVNPETAEHTALEGTWRDVRAVAACGEYIYAVDGRELYAIDPATGDAHQLHDSWEPRHLIGARDHLYAWQSDNQLYRFDPKTGAYEQLASTWALTTGVATALGRLFAVDDTILYEIDPDGTYKELDGRMRTRLLVGLHSCLYSFADNGDLYRIAVG